MNETEILDVAKAFVNAIEQGDIDAVRDCYAEDVAIWHNNDQQTQTRDENMRVLGWLQNQLSDIRYNIHRREVLPDGFFQEHVLTGKLTDGSAFAMPAIVICRVSGGKITELREYLDPTQAAALMS